MTAANSAESKRRGVEYSSFVQGAPEVLGRLICSGSCDEVPAGVDLGGGSLRQAHVVFSFRHFCCRRRAGGKVRLEEFQNERRSTEISVWPLKQRRAGSDQQVKRGRLAAFRAPGSSVDRSFQHRSRPGLPAAPGRPPVGDVSHRISSPQKSRPEADTSQRMGIQLHP